MSDLTRRINAVLGRTAGIQISPGRTRPVRLSAEWFTRLVYYDSLLEQVGSVPGDIVECGVAGGSSFAMLVSLMRARRQVRHAWGFDSWEGLPSPSDADLTRESSIATGGMFAWSSTRRVRDELVAYGWNDEEIRRGITLVPGLFDQTLPEFNSAIAFLHVDVDLYESYRSCLTNLWPKLQVGGIVAFDEYGEPEQWPGARRAVDEFLGSLPEGTSEPQLDDRSGKWWAKKYA